MSVCDDIVASRFFLGWSIIDTMVKYAILIIVNL